MLPAARFRSVVPLAPFACRLASTAAAQTRPAASVKIGGVKIAGSLRLCLAFSQSNAKSNVSLSLRRQQATWIGECLHSPEVAAQACTIAEYEV